MALIKCKVCESEYESTLEVCPNCGFKTPKKSEGTDNKKLIIGCGIGAFVLIVIILLVVGSKDTVTCTLKANEDSYGKMTSKVKATFKNDSLTKLTLSMEATLNDEEAAQAYYEEMQDEFDDFGEGVKTSVTKKGKKVTASASATKDDMAKLGLSTSGSKDDIIKSLEDTGYTCK